MAHPFNPFYLDGDFSKAIRISRTPREYPFRQNGDLTTYVYDATYVVSIDSFAAMAAGTINDEDSAVWLLAETRPEIFQGKLCTFRRTWSNIPSSQTVPSSMVLTKPGIEGTLGGTNCASYGDYRVFQPDTTLLRYDAYLARPVTSDSGAPTPYPTGGTYTVTFGGDTTTALSYATNAGNLQNALNALASIIARGYVTVTGAYNTPGGFVITFNNYAQITADITSLTGTTTPAKQESVLNGGYTQTIRAYVPGDLPLYPDFVMSGASLVATAAFTTGGSTADNTHWCVFNIYPSPGTFTGGTFALVIDGTTITLAYNCSLLALQNALDTAFPGLYTALRTANYSYGGNNYVWTDASVLSNNFMQIAFGIHAKDLACTGGTYTLTVGGTATSALAYNATAATVEAALNAIATVAARGNCTVTGSLLAGFVISFTNAPATSDASLTPVGATIDHTLADGSIGRVQRLTMSSPTQYRDLYVAGHGIVAPDVLCIKVAAGPAYYADLTNFTLPNANTIRFAITGDLAWATAVSITEVGRRTKLSYTPGSATVACKRITDFYLPGVSGGITTADDIIIPASQADASALLLAILSGSGTINVQVGELSQWRESAILALTRTTVRANNL